MSVSCSRYSRKYCIFDNFSIFEYTGIFEKILRIQKFVKSRKFRNFWNSKIWVARKANLFCKRSTLFIIIETGALWEFEILEIPKFTNFQDFYNLGTISFVSLSIKSCSSLVHLFPRINHPMLEFCFSDNWKIYLIEWKHHCIFKEFWRKGGKIFPNLAEMNLQYDISEREIYMQTLITTFLYNSQNQF